MPAADGPAAAPAIVFDPPATAARYAAQHPTEPYARAHFIRDLAYGPRPRNMLDVAVPIAPDRTARPVLVFVPGGPGNRREVAGYMFYDNVLLWAVDQGFVGVNMGRDSGADTTWDTGARNIAAVIEWVRQNIKAHGGDPNRIYVWGHSLGASSLATYIAHPELHPVAHPELYPERDIGLRGAILHSGSYNLAPLKATQPGRAPAGRQAPPDPETLLAQSSLPGLRKSQLPLLLIAADGDPLDRPEYVTMLKDALCSSGRCPTTLLVNGHDHFSEIFAINTRDQSVTKPVLDWLGKVAVSK